MRIIPAIDILQGSVVRLYQGDYEAVSHYAKNPLQAALEIHEMGFKELHLIDLQGAKEGRPFIADLVGQISSLGLQVQVGGGIRTLETAQKYLASGAKRLITGTKALNDPLFLEEIIGKCRQESIMVSLDVKHGKVALNGWTETSNESPFAVIERLAALKLKHLIVTDVSKDGTLSGIDPELYRSIAHAYPELILYAAGGITTIENIHALEAAGVSGAIIGRAFYELPQFRSWLITKEQK